MKVIFYSATLAWNQLTPNDKIIYCQLLHRSIMDGGVETFSADTGDLRLDEYRHNNGRWLPLGWSATPAIIEHLTTTERQFYRAKKALKECGILTDDAIYIPDNIEKSFFTLSVETGLRGLSLITHSYLRHLTNKYGWIDKYHNKIAENLFMDRGNLEHILSNLRSLGFVEVKHKGKQTLLRAI